MSTDGSQASDSPERKENPRQRILENRKVASINPYTSKKVWAKEKIK